MRLSDLPIDRPVAIGMLLICITVLGSVAVTRLPLAFMPVVLEPEIDVTIPFEGSHPLEALNDVIRPIEAEIATIPDVRRIWANAGRGDVRIEASFDWGINVDLKRMEVREAVERVRPQLPEGTGHIRIEGDTGGPDSEILGGRISANRDLSESWALLDRRIRRPLERVRGVASISLYGVEAQQVRIDLDLASLERHQIRVGELISTINDANLDLDLGAIRGASVRYDVRSEARFEDVATIRNLPLRTEGLRLRDVATVSLREPVLNYGRHLNTNFAVGFDVMKESSANTVETVARLHARLDEIRQDPELQGIEVLVWQDQGEEIMNSLNGLRNAGIFGGCLAILVLFGFLKRFSTTAIVGVSIPFSLLVTCGVMLLLGAELNVLSMLGLMLGVGMLVDNAVVVIENIYRLQGKGIPAVEAARRGARQVSLAVFAATSTTIIVWSWLFVTEAGQMTIYIGQVALTICLSVACSLLISLTFIPLAAARISPRSQPKPGFVMRRLVPRYRQLLGWSLAGNGRRLLLLGLMFLIGASAGIPIALIEKSGEPVEQKKEISINYRIHDAYTKEELEIRVDEVETLLEQNKEQLGYENIYSWYSEPNSAVTRVYLPPDQLSEETYTALRDGLEALIPTMAGIDLEIGERRGRHGGPRRKSAVSVVVRGEDPEYLETVALDVENALRELDDVHEVYGPTLNGQQEVRVRLDVERARQLGVDPDVAAGAVGFNFRGQRLRRMQHPDGEVEILLGLPEDARPGLSAIEDLPIPTREGKAVDLHNIATVDLARTPAHLNREDRETSQWVTVQFDEEAVTTEEGRARVDERMASLSLPQGYSWGWSQRMHDDDEALGIMVRGVSISLFVVLLLMTALFESFSQASAILITLPLAFFGAFWTLWLLGYTLEVVAFIGIILLIGIVVNNGIVMVDHVNSLRREGRSRTDALVEGCGDRLRPILMTAITTVTGLIPLALSQFTVAGVFVQSMAVAMIGGLVSSSLMTLVALPVWYTVVEDFGAGLLRFFRELLNVRPGQRKSVADV
ncbi:MAG: efflux RND transporter permease subunit [Acidobacteriota bacterium]|nr:efflux RND transporter permease subunit [Acidobacteriota bacterium]